MPSLPVTFSRLKAKFAASRFGMMSRFASTLSRESCTGRVTCTREPDQAAGAGAGERASRRPAGLSAQMYFVRPPQTSTVVPVM